MFKFGCSANDYDKIIFFYDQLNERFQKDKQKKLTLGMNHDKSMLVQRENIDIVRSQPIQMVPLIPNHNRHLNKKDKTKFWFF